jgi:type I restriction enzyme, S subunit
MSAVPPSGWSPRKLNELGFVGRGKSKHRPRNAPSLYGGPYPFVQTGDVKAADLYILHYEQTYSEQGLAQSKLWDPGTLCITIAANIAETAILKIQACFPDSIVGFVADPDKADVRFVKYYIDTLKLQMQNASRGTTQDNLSLEKLLTFDFYIPPLSTQRKIAAILSAYDDLIEVNTRRIALLEEMARGLYREWFVRFRFPGHEGVRMVESAVGLAPEGWEAKMLGDAVELAYGKGLTADTRIPGAVPVYGSAGVVGYHNESLVKGPGIIVGRKGNVGSVFWSDDDFFPIDTVFYVRTKLALHYVFYALQNQHFINSDAAVPGLSRNQAYLNPFLVPDQHTMNAFAEFVVPIFAQTRNLRQKNANLRRTRDLLLPRLVAGEVNVDVDELRLTDRV